VQQLLSGLLSLSLIINLLTLQATLGLLFSPLGLVSGSSLLGLGGDLNSELDGLLKGVSGSLIDGLDGLDINVGDEEIVSLEVESVSDLSFVVSSEDSLADEVSGVLVEVIEALRGDGTSDSGGNSLAEITDEIGNGEEEGGMFLVLLVNFEVPVVGELQGETGVVRSLDDDDISGETGSKQEGNDVKDLGGLGGVSGEGEDGELFIRSEHDEVRSEDDASLLSLVIVDLDSRVVRNSVGHNTALIAGSSDAVLDSRGLVSIGLEEFLNGGRELLVPQLLIRGKHVDSSRNSSDSTSLHVSHIDTFVLIKRNSAASFDDFNLNGGNIVGRTVDHPAVTGGSRDIVITESFASTQEEGFF